ncbi:MAG: gamma-glutamyltransferase, partial [bacterium]|nr:gamma-glutamyltransferase [bacterium]
GGGGLALLWSSKQKRATALDFRERAPKGAAPKMFRQAGIPPDASKNGPLAIAVPGEVAGLGMLHQKWGQMKWKDLFSDAIQLAKEGFTADSALLDRAGSRKECLSRDYHSWKLFRPLFRPPSDLNTEEFHDEEEEAEAQPIRWKQPQLAKTLERLRDRGPGDFYTGELAYRMISNLKGKGALLRLSDLRDYQVKERLPLVNRFPFGKVWGFPLPSSGGISVIRGLNTLEALEKKTKKRGPWLIWMVQVSNQIFATRNAKMGDSDFVGNQPVRNWVSKPFARGQAQKILEGQAMKAAAGNSTTSGQTTHLSIMDAAGNAIALTLTLNLSFGSCVTAGNTGILMNNEMDDFSTHPGTPNAFGLVQSEANNIEGGKRPLSSMSPTLVTQKSQPVLAIGSPGGPRIITAILQVLYRHYFLRQNLADAIRAPRIHYQGIPNKIFVESKVGEKAKAKLKALNIPLQTGGAWGNVEAVAFDPATGQFSAQSDPRAIGKSLVVQTQ